MERENPNPPDFAIHFPRIKLYFMRWPNFFCWILTAQTLKHFLKKPPPVIHHLFHANLKLAIKKALRIIWIIFLYFQFPKGLCGGATARLLGILPKLFASPLAKFQKIFFQLGNKF